MKKLVLSLLMSTAVLGISVTSEAAVTVNDDNTIISDATIKITEGNPDDPTPPVDPNKPDTPTDQPGNLTIDNVISFNFEDMAISGKTQNINLKTSAAGATTDISEAKRNIQVTDKTGSGLGWSLQIKQSDLVDGTKTLKGAYIKMNAGVVQTTTDNSDPTLAPTTAAYDIGATNKGQYAQIMTAEATKGMGTWLSFYNQDVASGNVYEGTPYTQKTNPTDIQLVVPSGNLTGNYSGTVTWSLTSTPAAPTA